MSERYQEKRRYPQTPSAPKKEEVLPTKPEFDFMDYSDSYLAGMLKGVVDSDPRYANMTIQEIREEAIQRLNRNASIRSAVLSVELWLQQSKMSSDEIMAWASSVEKK
jgi:hypothetical protein